MARQLLDRQPGSGSSVDFWIICCLLDHLQGVEVREPVTHHTILPFPLFILPSLQPHPRSTCPSPRNGNYKQRRDLATDSLPELGQTASSGPNTTHTDKTVPATMAEQLPSANQVWGQGAPFPPSL